VPLLGSYLDRDGLKIAIGGVAGVRAQLVDGTFLVDGGDIASWVLFVESRLVIRTSEINARLKKRYAVPFEEPSQVVCGWLAALVLPDLYEARGWDDSDAFAQSIAAGATLAREQMKEAADSEVGLFDLPLRQDEDAASGISKGGPLGYAEASPYTWMDEQVAAVDRAGER